METNEKVLKIRGAEIVVDNDLNNTLHRLKRRSSGGNTHVNTMSQRHDGSPQITAIEI